MRFKRIGFIKQAHGVFSAYARASFSGNTNAMASSLVFADHFIHGYDFGIANEDSFLSLRTYSRNDNTSFRFTFLGFDDPVQKTWKYLRVSCASRSINRP